MCAWISGVVNRNKSIQLKAPLFWPLYGLAVVVHVFQIFGAFVVSLESTQSDEAPEGGGTAVGPEASTDL